MNLSLLTQHYVVFLNFQIVDDENKEAGLGNLKIRLNDLLAAPKMTKEEPFNLSGSGPNSKIQLRVSIRVCLSII